MKKYTGNPFAASNLSTIGASVEIAKRSELHKFAVIPKRWVVERSLTWLDKCRCHWKICERKLNSASTWSFWLSLLYSSKDHEQVLRARPNKIAPRGIA